MNGAELFDPTTDTFLPTDHEMGVHCEWATATALDDCRVLVAGGSVSDRQAELYVSSDLECHAMHRVFANGVESSVPKY